MPYKDIEKIREANRKSYYKHKDKKYKNCPKCGKKIWIKSNTCKRCRTLTTKEKEKLSLVSKGSNNSGWKGGRRKELGYVYIYVPNHPNAKKNYIVEHRLVMEKKLGRYLKKSEVVHHIDFDKSNNKIENLMLFETAGKHMKFHTKIKQFGMTNPIKRQIENRWKELKKTEKDLKNLELL